MHEPIFDIIVLTAGITVGGKNPATTTARVAAKRAYSMRSCPSFLCQSAISSSFIVCGSRPPSIFMMKYRSRRGNPSYTRPTLKRSPRCLEPSASEALPRGDAIGAHKRLKCLWNQYATVLLLVVLHDRYPSASYRQAAAVEGMRELGFTLSRPHPNGCPPRLKTLEIRTG